MIHYGFHEVPIVENSNTLFDIGGKIIFKGTAHIGKGTRIVVGKNALVELGNNFAISAASFIYCYKHIMFGDNVQLSWNDLIMDSDSHYIYDTAGIIINKNKDIVVGDNVWIGCDCKILKGANIPEVCVIGANSVVTAAPIETHTLVIGAPAKSVKKISGWKI